MWARPARPLDLRPGSRKDRLPEVSSGLGVWECPLSCSLLPSQRKESDNKGLGQRVAALSSQVEGLSNTASLDAGGPAALQKKLWDLESRASEQQQELSQQTKAVEQLEQVRPLLVTLWLPVFLSGVEAS